MKYKNNIGEMKMMDPRFILAIPGMWKDRSEIVSAIATKSNGYLLTGDILQNVENEMKFEIEIYEQDDSLEEAFQYAGGGKFKRKQLKEIRKHTHILFLMTNESGVSVAKELINAGKGLLNAGGIAVKVETVGIAFSKEEWEELDQNVDEFSIYSHMVTLVGDEDHGKFYSFGMKAFEAPDAMISTEFDPEDAAEALNDFNFYCLTEQPTLTDGDTIALGEEGLTYAIRLQEDFRYDTEDLYHNPLGIWELSIEN
jgi:hypothetical protein